MSKAKTTRRKRTSHLAVASEIAAMANKIGAAAQSNRERVTSPFRSRKPNEDDPSLASDLMHAVADALAGVGSWDLVRGAHAGMVAAKGEQDRKTAAVERCREALTAWRGLDRKRPKRESADERRVRFEAVQTEEKWIAGALAASLRELGYAPRRVEQLLAKVAKRADGSPFTLARNLLDLTEDSLRTAERKKRQVRST
jgi:hypothetical protein